MARQFATGTEYLNERQVGERFALPVASLRTWRTRGGGPPYVKVGRRVLYKLADVVAWLDARRVDPEAKPGTSAKRKAARAGAA